MEIEQAGKLLKAAIAWAEQRDRYFKSSGLGKASCRAALCRKADKLSNLAMYLKPLRMPLPSPPKEPK